MQDATDERRVTYGLRHKATGKMLRVEHEADLGGDSENPTAETTYRFTTSEGYPIFDAGSPERLAAVFAYPYPGSEDNPYRGDFTPDNVEAVVIEEVVNRTVRPVGRPFDVFEVPMRIDISYAVDVNRSLAKHVAGLAELLDVIEPMGPEIVSQTQLGSTYKSGPYSLVGLIVPGEVSDLPEGFEGNVIADSRGHGSRRGLTALQLPDKLRHLGQKGHDVPAAATMIVCLADMRQAPARLIEALKDVHADKAPAPR